MKKKKIQLEFILSRYNSIIQNFSDSKSGYKYYMLFIWMLILFVISYITILSIIEPRNDMNNLYKFLIYLISLIIFYNVFESLYSYFNGYELKFNIIN